VVFDLYGIFRIKEGDLWPPLSANLLQANNEPITLQEEDEIYFIMTPKNDRENVIINKAAQIKNYEEGEVEYIWEQGDTDIPDIYQAEFLIKLNKTQPIRVPNNGYFTVIIDNKLG
jgi:hypothetical protein